MSQSLRGVCVGAGYFSRFQYESWHRMPGVEITAMCNRSVERAQPLADEFGIPKVYTIDDFGAMLDAEKPDFVDIITPPNTHLELCREAAARLNHGSPWPTPVFPHGLVPKVSDK